MGPAVRSDVCPQPHYWGYSQTGVCGYLLLSLGHESLWSGIGLCQHCLHTASHVALYPMLQTGLSGGGSFAEEHSVGAHSTSNVCTGPLWEGVKAGQVKGMDLQKCTR